MLGDHFQLPPTVRSPAAGEKGLGESLFSRLVKDSNISPFVLNVQYRMHPLSTSTPLFTPSCLLSLSPLPVPPVDVC